jgi:coproporphyrinogen III oxidase
MLCFFLSCVPNFLLFLSSSTAFLFVSSHIPFPSFAQRGVKFGLRTENPRVEGVMVSAPPEIAYHYKHEVDADSPEGRLVKVLKTPVSWV